MNFLKINNKNQQRGQAMLVSVLFISGLIASSTTIAGLLMVYQVRQSIDAGSSTQATYGADAGVERAFECYFHFVGEIQDDSCDLPNPSNTDPITFTNGVSFTYDLKCGDVSRNEVNCSDSSLVKSIIVLSQGGAGDVKRVLETNYDLR